MRIFKSFTLNWWQTGLFKLSMIALGIIIGVYFKEFFLPWIVGVTIVWIVPALYLVRVWARQ